MNPTSVVRTTMHAQCSVHPHLAPSVLLALACALSLAGCPSRSHAPVEAAALARTQPALAWRVNHARVTHHLATSSLESRDAMPGHQFVVLDVSVRNRDAQPQVLSEGKLIALDEAQLQTFDQPETLLSDDYLSLQVLAPAQSLHGKIAYEVPDPLSGVLYWSPGNGSERILLNPVATPASPSTLADAAVDDDSGDNAADARIQPTGAAAVVDNATHAPSPARVTAPKLPSKPTRDVARAQPAPSPKVLLDAPVDAPVVDMPAVAPIADEPALALTPASSRPSATLAVLPPAPIPRAVPARPIVAAPSVDPREADRRQACAELVARDDPRDKAGNLDFFAVSCRDYTLPAHWSPPPAPPRSLIARVASRASALLARVMVAPRVERISDCSSAAASRADTLVCADPALSAMDHRLAQTVARARDQVDDPAALQREQEHWRGHVRNACNTTRCLQQAYGRRIAQLDALTPMRP